MALYSENASKTSNDLIESFINGLKSRNEEQRLKTAKDLQHYVNYELQELSTEDINAFIETFNKYIFEMMISNSDINDKKGGILAIVILVGIDVDTQTHSIICSRFANYLRNLITHDASLMELAAYAVGKIALESGTLTASYVDYEVKRAIEWLSSERNEAKRLGAVRIYV